MPNVDFLFKGGLEMRRGSRLLVLVALLMGAASCLLPESREPPSSAVLDIALSDLEGGTRRLADLQGQVVLVEFWATWCGPCRAQAKVLEEIYPDYDGQPVVFVGVDVGESVEKVEKYVAEKAPSYHIWLDREERLANAAGVLGLPSLMVVDAKGEIRLFRFGVTPHRILRNAIDEALGEISAA